MPHVATIKSLPRAFRIMKAMQAQGIEWSGDYRQAAHVGKHLAAATKGVDERIDNHIVL